MKGRKTGSKIQPQQQRPDRYHQHTYTKKVHVTAHFSGLAQTSQQKLRRGKTNFMQKG
jgi:hypothetical protein